MVEEIPPDSGNWAETIVEHKYYGDIIQQTVRNENSSNLNDDFSIDNEISVVADSFLLENTGRMRYITFLGSKWKIRSISVVYPRLILSIGGVYNGRTGPSDYVAEVPVDTTGS